MYIMSYFTDSELCARLAKSEDLLHWEDMNGGKPVVYKTEDTLIRDPFMIRDKDGLYHMLFTVNWNGNLLGHCVGKTLTDFSDTRFIPVMPENAKNVWAPECIYDEENDEYIIFWSSTVDEDDYDHRIWHCKTKDFESFSQAEIFFDPGYSVIDASIIKVGGKYIMAFKDERGTHKKDTDSKDIHLAFSDKAAGPYGDITKPISQHLCEGPCMVKKDSGYYIFFESFIEHYYNGLYTEDFKSFENISGRIDFPADCKHFSIIEVESDETVA
ncbi:MAG: glycoside hydrolase family 43 protein [Oscillospiraceae bacterium]|nr:glycoside hydrolase family 43 protein [Oscillospiraceae bacterium]